MRINARLDEERTRKIEYLTRATRSTVTGVVRDAIDRYYQEVSARPRHSAALLEEVGFVGCADGPADLSSRHDELLGEDLEAKHGDR